MVVDSSEGFFLVDLKKNLPLAKKILAVKKFKPKVKTFPKKGLLLVLPPLLLAVFFVLSDLLFFFLFPVDMFGQLMFNFSPLIMLDLIFFFFPSHSCIQYLRSLNPSFFGDTRKLEKGEKKLNSCPC